MGMIRAEEISKLISKEINNFNHEMEKYEIGTVLSISDGVVRAYGLEQAKSGELVEFEDHTKGLILNLEEDSVGIAVVGENNNIKEGQIIRRTYKIASIEVGNSLLGRILNGIGEPIDEQGPLKSNVTK